MVDAWGLQTITCSMSEFLLKNEYAPQELLRMVAPSAAASSNALRTCESLANDAPMLDR